LASVWPGCGGSGGPSAAFKLQVRHDLLHGTLDGPLLQPGRAQDRTSPHQQQALPAGALRLTDLGFFKLADLRERAERGEYWLTRLQAGTAVFTADGQRWTLPALLAAQPPGSVDLPVEVGVSERVACRLLHPEGTRRVPQEVADQRRRRLYEAARKKGQAVSRERLALCDWTVLITNVPPALLTLREALVLARARWQIELLFKLWKSHNQIDEWRTANPWRILCEVYAKLIAVVIQHWLLLVGGWHYPDHSLAKAAQVVRAWALTLALALGSRRRLVAALTVLVRALRRGSRISKRRQHPALYQLLLALEDLETAAEAPAPPPAAGLPPAPQPSLLAA
jgi:Transposase DDE domain